MIRKGKASSIIALFLSLCMIVSFTPAIAFASDEGDRDDTLNYVSIGASNVNGFGLRGYITDPNDPEKKPDEVMKDAALDASFKNASNVLGYGHSPAESYPALLTKALEKKNLNVKHDQLAISSMRAEELRILLDDSYSGDVYSKWRFIGEGKFFDIADGKSDGDFSQLRGEYRTAIRNADLVTVDIGINNFGVYLGYMIGNSNTEANDVSKIDENLGKKYKAMKDQVEEVLSEYVDLDSFKDFKEYDSLVDTLAYAFIGFCYNFDKSMEKIYELNPDAEVIVVSIQNLLSGIKLTVGDKEIPFGDVIGALINTANVYIATESPYAEKYLFSDVRKNGRVDFFIDDIIAYNGDPSSLSNNIIDCFDVYDGGPGASYDDGMHIKYMLYNYLVNALTTPEDSGGLGVMTKSQFNGMVTQNNGDIEATLTQIVDAPEVKGPGALKNILMAAYDAYAQILQACAKCDTVDIGALSTYKTGTKPLVAGIEQELKNSVNCAIEGNEYTFPEAFFDNIAQGSHLPVSHIKSVASMGLRTDIGNSFFGHPNPYGHEKIAAAVLTTYENGTTGSDAIVVDQVLYIKKKIESGELEEAMKQLKSITEKIAQNPELQKAVKDAYAEVIDKLIEQIDEKNIKEIKELKKLVEYVQQLSAELPQIYAQFEKKVKEDIKSIAELTKKQMGDIYSIIEKNINNPEAMIAEIVNYLEEQGYPEGVVKEVEKQLNALLDEYNKEVAEIQAQIEQFMNANKEKFDKFFDDVQMVINVYNEYKAIYEKMPKSCEEWKTLIQKIVQERVDAVCEYADTAAEFIDMMTAMVDYPEDALESFDAYRENVVTASYIKDCSMLIDLAVGMLGDLPKEVKEFISYDKLKAASEKLYEAGKNFHAAIEALGDKVSENIGDLNTTIDAMDDHISMLVNNIDKLNKDKAKLSKKYTELYTKVYAKVLPLKKGQKLVASKNIKYRTKADGVKSVKTSNKKVVKVYKKSGKYYIKGIKAKKSATVTVKFNSGVSRSYKVSVQKNAVQPKTIAVKYNGKTISSKTLKKGKKIKLTVSKSPVSCVKKAVFKSSNKKVVKTSKSGIVKAYKKGTAKVTVKVGNKKKVVVFKVK